MVGFVGHTKSFALSASTPVLIAPYSLHRKGVMVSNPDTTPIWVAVGMNPADTDFFQLGVNKNLLLDDLVPISPVWAKGVGRAVVLDNEVGLEPYDVNDLFKKTEGVWFDFSDMSTMWQDVNGLVPVTASGQPVGLVLGKDKPLGASTIGPGAITASGTGVTVSGTTINIDDPESAAGRTFAIVVGAVNPVPGKAVLDITCYSTSGSYRLEAAGMRSIPLLQGRNRYIMDVPTGSTGNFAVGGTAGAGAYKGSININNIRRVNARWIAAKDPAKRGVFIKDKQLGYLQLNGDAEYVIPDSKNMFPYLNSRDGRTLVASAFRCETKEDDYRLGAFYGNNGMFTGKNGSSLGIDRRTSTDKIHGIGMSTKTGGGPSYYFQVEKEVSTTQNYLISQILDPTGVESMACRVYLNNVSVSIGYGFPKPGPTTFDMSIAGAGNMDGHAVPFASNFLGRMYSLLIAKDVSADVEPMVLRALAADAEVPF